MKKSTLIEIVNEAYAIANTEKSIDTVKSIKTETHEELGKTVIYITAICENKHFFKGYGWKRTGFRDEFIYIEETHELLDRNWGLIA